ncbi:myosin-11-like isoform X3 [Sitophilus oryzae]|uniref:Myosin-11-like isoform X3 n=1 Tax=Sitophilus oryzae TaxID=7048 RepID=A0A6J2YXF9_SITOR|nr:myosin-11-like isoform X3 [Sitophilus oryzae]
MLEQTKLFMGNITSENCMLKNEVTSLNKLLLETGAGDIKKQIDTNKEEIAQFQEEIQKLQKEKRLLAVEFEGIQSENAVLLQNQEIAYKNLQRQIKELEKVNHQNKHLKEKYETEHHTLQTLQNERMKYLEEKSLLKSIIQQLKGEIAKVPLLEDDLTNVSRKASKLGLIAEYNKQQGEKLKEEIIERDKVITQLKDNVQKLNELQIENAKEKLSLCYELNEVCQLKEKLSEVLNTEVRKNAELGQSKEAIAKSVQKIEEKQKNERSAIRALLKDIKTLTEEKQELVKENKSLESQINSLSIKVAEKENKINEMNRESDRKDQEIADLRKDTQRLEKCKNEITEKVNIETTKYDMNIRQLKVLIDKLRQENTEYDSTIKYLKNNTEKLQKDLDASRQKEMKAKDMVNQLTIRQKTDEKLIADKLGIINVINMEKEHLLELNMKITSENEKLSKDIAHLNSLLDKIVNDFQNSIKASEQKEHMFKSEQTESRNLIQQYIRETEELKNMIEKRDKEIFELNKCTENEISFEKKYSKLKQEMESKLSSVEDHNKSLQFELHELQDEYDVKNGFCKRLQNEIEILKTQLEIIMNQKDEEYEFYKKRLAENARTQEESESKGKKEIQKLEQQLRELTQKMDNEKSAYETLAQIHKDISGKFMKSIKELVDIKNSKQELADELKNMYNSVKQLEQEKAELNKQVFNLSGEIESLNSTVVELREKNNCLQDSYSSAVDKCETLSNMPEYYNFESNDQIRDKIYSLEREVTELRKEIEENRLSEHEMKKEICQFQQEITLLEIQRNDVTLQLHEIEKKFHTEKSISEQLSNTHKLLLGAVIQMRDAGKVDSSDCLHLLHMMSNSNSLSEENRNSLN